MNESSLTIHTFAGVGFGVSCGIILFSHNYMRQKVNASLPLERQIPFYIWPRSFSTYVKDPLYTPRTVIKEYRSRFPQSHVPLLMKLAALVVVITLAMKVRYA